MSHETYIALCVVMVLGVMVAILEGCHKRKKASGLWLALLNHPNFARWCVLCRGGIVASFLVCHVVIGSTMILSLLRVLIFYGITAILMVVLFLDIDYWLDLRKSVSPTLELNQSISQALKGEHRHSSSLLCRLVGHRWWRRDHKQWVEGGHKNEMLTNVQRPSCEWCGMPNPSFGFKIEELTSK